MGIKWADAWQKLVYEHSPFKAVDDDDFQPLLEQLSDLEKLFLDNPELEPYYAELRGEVYSTEAPASADSAAGDGKRDVRTAAVHVAAIQLQLMEDVFYSLRLDRYANAPDNRGWMNLFRQWSVSPTFQAHADALEARFSQHFIDFYDLYIKDWRIDLPVPHPWDVSAAERRWERTKAAAKPADDAAEPYADVTMEAVKMCRLPRPSRRKGKGMFLDSGLVEAGESGAVEEPHTPTGSEHGQAPDSSSSSAPSSPGSTPAAGGEDSSNKTD